MSYPPVTMAAWTRLVWFCCPVRGSALSSGTSYGRTSMRQRLLSGIPARARWPTTSQLRPPKVEGWDHARVALVAHSLGGVVGMRLAAHLGDRVAGFIGISAAIPINGGSFVSALPFPQKVIVRLMLRLAGTRPPDAAIRKGLCSDLTTEQADQIVARFTPESRAVYTDRVDVAPPDVPRRYVVLTADREFPPSLQARFARRLGGNQIELDSGHLPMVSQPGELAKLLARFLSDAVAP